VLCLCEPGEYRIKALPSDLDGRGARMERILKKFKLGREILLASGVFILFMALLRDAAEGFIAITFRQYLCNSSYFSEKSISCAVTAKPVEFSAFVLTHAHKIQTLISRSGFFNLRICYGGNLFLWVAQFARAINGAHQNSRRRPFSDLLLSRGGEKLLAFFSGRVIYSKRKMLDVCINLAL